MKGRLIFEWLKRKAPAMLSIAASGGVFGVAWLSSRAGRRSAEALKSAEAAKGEKLTKVETLKAAAPLYISTGVACAGTVGCIVGAHLLNRKQNAALAAALMAAGLKYDKYRQKVKGIFGDGADRVVSDSIEEDEKRASCGMPAGDVKMHFIISIEDLDIHFESTLEKVYLAEYLLNRLFCLRSYASVNDLVEIFGLDRVEGYDEFGWEAYIGEACYGYQWIDFYHNFDDDADGMPSCWIEFPFEPHPMDEEENDRYMQTELMPEKLGIGEKREVDASALERR